MSSFSSSEAAPSLVNGTRTVPGTSLETLAIRMKLTGVEWRVAALVLAKEPISARQVTRWLRLKYGHVKRTARELIRWHILVRSGEGLRFQPDPARWERHERREAVPR